MLKKLLIDAIYGLDPPYGGDKWSKFCGNSWNENWIYEKEKLKRESIKTLIRLYLSLKKEEIEI